MSSTPQAPLSSEINPCTIHVFQRIERLNYTPNPCVSSSVTSRYLAHTSTVIWSQSRSRPLESAADSSHSRSPDYADHQMSAKASFALNGLEPPRSAVHQNNGKYAREAQLLRSQVSMCSRAFNLAKGGLCGRAWRAGVQCPPGPCY